MSALQDFQLTSKWSSPFFQPPFYSRNTAEMYDNILNKPLQLKPNITNSARHVLEGLLQKDRTKRLGAKDDFVSHFSCPPGLSGRALDLTALLEFQASKFMFPSQQMEIKNHVFFSLINWEDLINKKITPPFNPNVVSSSPAWLETQGLLFKSELMALVEVGSPRKE